MSDLFGNHIVGFSTRWLKCDRCKFISYKWCCDGLIKIHSLQVHIKTFFYYSVLRPFQDYFSSISQSVGGVKTEEAREKPPGTPASRTWFVLHVASASCAGLEPTPDTAVR